MKKIFVFLLSAVLLFKQVSEIKVNAEPTKLCRDLISFLDHNCNDRNNIYKFSPDDLLNELRNYDENDFCVGDRSFSNKAIRAYHAALDVFNDALHREIPDVYDQDILVGTSVEGFLETNPEYVEAQVQAIHNYLFEGMSESTISITTSGIKDEESEPEVDFLSDDSGMTIGITLDNSLDNFVYSENFKAENKEVFTRYLSVFLDRHDEEWIAQNSHLLLIFMARAFFSYYDDGARFFHVYTDDDNYQITNANVLLFNGAQTIEIDSLSWGL